MTALEKIKQWDKEKGEGTIGFSIFGWSLGTTNDIARIMDDYLKEKVEEYCKKLWDNTFDEGSGHCVFMDDVERILQEK